MSVKKDNGLKGSRKVPEVDFPNSLLALPVCLRGASDPDMPAKGVMLRLEIASASESVMIAIRATRRASLDAANTCIVRKLRTPLATIVLEIPTGECFVGAAAESIPDYSCSM